ncbi:hypothetical protein ACFSKU_10800 [Pontibacter silvestris]|uniref:Transposase n=1 Tax=Pontibacter silvestris TaxID=2305183 RepID=A0ABW4WYT1_9BACT|nr:hypothetical protein [Pontibacter silvestris]MCC9138997.1 hypothetical protein [Pontibacter silvestris]
MERISYYGYRVALRIEQLKLLTELIVEHESKKPPSDPNDGAQAPTTLP